ncbi:MAG: 4-(cytidine 5'-diphospho)-2-C-methyl-D-erythritol kinase [Propionibacteriaceae bacterium]|nr:4-(cytidine 5'-diphospho)-2-C-methyl-D-erythritol kinase [Propionibacteriaceae bacterium]
MTSLTVRVPGKVNLALQVGPCQADGYHDLATVFMALSIEDTVTATGPLDTPGDITATVSGPGAQWVGSGLDNLAVRAASLLRDRFGSPELSASLAIEKRIPVAGGMAGGSADAAGALLACARLWQLDVTSADLTDLAAELGADVPFALLGGCALGLGRGDRLTPVLARGRFHWVLAFHRRGLSTSAVFRRFDEYRPNPAPAVVPSALLTALAAGDVRALGAALSNDLTVASVSLAPALRRTIEAGREAGALGSVISGSGPTVALLAASEEAANTLAVRLSSEGVAHRLVRAWGPVPGAHVVTD